MRGFYRIRMMHSVAPGRGSLSVAVQFLLTYCVQLIIPLFAIRRANMALTAEQKAFFEENGYLAYDKRILSDEEIAALRQRSEEIVYGRMNHVPPRYIQLEAAFRDDNGNTSDRLDQVRKMTHLCYFDPVFESVAKKPEIVDVIEELIGPNI